MMIRLPSSPNLTYADIRRELVEVAPKGDLPTPFKFTVEAGGILVLPKQEKNWKLSELGLSSQDGLGRDGSYKTPFKVFIKGDYEC